MPWPMKPIVWASVTAGAPSSASVLFSATWMSGALSISVPSRSKTMAPFMPLST
ncbi:MAG: hypothetical protein R3D87_11445 [Paracoccaceae bacterium]